MELARCVRKARCVMSVTLTRWNDEFKLGLPAMDSEHRQLLELCNEFLEAAQANRPMRELAAVLDRLILGTRTHFLAEERLLDRHNYPGLAAHKAEHDRLLVQAQSLKTRFDDIAHQDDTRNLTLETADYLQLWLLNHIRTDDRPYRPFLMSLA